MINIVVCVLCKSRNVNFICIEMGGLVMFRRVFFFLKNFITVYTFKKGRAVLFFQINAFFFFSTRKNMKECPVASVKAKDPLFTCNHTTGRWILVKQPKMPVHKNTVHVADVEMVKEGADLCRPESAAKYLSRNSPAYSAANCPVGMLKKGKDGFVYVVSKDKNGVHRWKKAALTNVDQTPPKPKKKEEPKPKPKATPDKVTLSVQKMQQDMEQIMYDIAKGVMKYKQLRPKQVQENKEAMLKRYVDEMYFASRKYDGWQSVWDGKGTLSTKTGKNTFPLPDSWKKVLPKGIPLAGELIIPGKQATHVASLKKKDSKDWAHAKFMIFDSPSTSSKVPFSERYAKLQKIATLHHHPLYLVPQVKITSVDHLYDLYRQVLSEKGEGLVLTKASSLYIPEKQSYQRVKLKGRSDTEGVIVGYLRNEKDPRLLKSLIVKMDNGVETRIGIGFTTMERKNFQKLFPLGKLVKFSYREFTDNGQPKQSRFIGIRQDLG